MRGYHATVREKCYDLLFDTISLFLDGTSYAGQLAFPQKSGLSTRENPRTREDILRKDIFPDFRIDLGMLFEDLGLLKRNYL